MDVGAEGLDLVPIELRCEILEATVAGIVEELLLVTWGGKIDLDEVDLDILLLGVQEVGGDGVVVGADGGLRGVARALVMAPKRNGSSLSVFGLMTTRVPLTSRRG